MYKNLSNPLFLMILIMGTMISISSSSWLGAWMGLEINLLSFIPLMNDSKNLMSNESSMKYFLIQAFASTVLMAAIILELMQNSFIEMLSFKAELANYCMTFSLLLKMGAAPLHFWFPGVMEGLQWMNALLLMVWQKIAPMMLISYLIDNFFIIISIITCIIIGSMGGLNQTSLRKIMAFSSINHIGWMLSSMMYNDNLWFFYFLIYSFINTSISFLFNKMKTFHLKQLYNTPYLSSSFKFFIMMNFLSLGGLPPFLGFLPKWLVIQNMTANNHLLLMFMATLFTLITLIFYLRITFTGFMINYSTNNWNNSINMINPQQIIALTAINLISLPVFSIMYLPL